MQLTRYAMSLGNEHQMQRHKRGLVGHLTFMPIRLAMLFRRLRNKQSRLVRLIDLIEIANAIKPIRGLINLETIQS